MKNNKLLSNTMYLYLLTIVKMLFPLVTLPYLTRILSVDAYGSVAYIKSYMSYVQLVIDFGFLLSATKDIALVKGKNDEKIPYIVGDTFVEKIILLILSAGVTAVVSLFIPILRENQLFTWLYFIAVGLTIFLPDYLYRGIERMECVTIPFTASKAVSIILTLVLIKNDSDLILIPIFEIVSNLIAVIISLSLLKKLNIAVKITGLKKWITDLKASAVYFLSNFATTVFGALTTLIVGVLLNEEDVAYWSVCMQIVSAAKAMYTPIANSIYPHMVTNKDLKLVRKIRNLMTIPMVIGTIAVMVFGEDIMVIIGGENYEYAGTILKFLLPVIVVSFYSMLYGWPVLGAINKVKQTTVSTVIAAVIQIVGILLIYVCSSFNLISLAICCCVSEIALLIIRLIIFKRNRELFSN